MKVEPPLIVDQVIDKIYFGDANLEGRGVPDKTDFTRAVNWRILLETSKKRDFTLDPRSVFAGPYKPEVDYNESMARKKPLNMTNVQVREANLSEGYFPYILADEADLEGTNFERAMLAEGSFKSAQLNGAILRNAELKNTNFYEAQLAEADLREAKMVCADLREANLSGARLERAVLVKARMNGTNLQGANLSEARLEGVCFDEADLKGANLSGSNFWDAYLATANLAITTGANIYQQTGAGQNQAFLAILVPKYKEPGKPFEERIVVQTSLDGFVRTMGEDEIDDEDREKRCLIERLSVFESRLKEEFSEKPEVIEQYARFIRNAVEELRHKDK